MQLGCSSNLVSELLTVAGYFHTWFALQKCSSEIEICTKKTPPAGYFVHNPNLDTVLDYFARVCRTGSMTNANVFRIIYAPSAPRQKCTSPVWLDRSWMSFAISRSASMSCEWKKMILYNCFDTSIPFAKRNWIPGEIWVEISSSRKSLEFTKS